MTKILIVWMNFRNRLLSCLSSGAYTTQQTDTDKFEKLQLRFRFLIASTQPLSCALWWAALRLHRVVQIIQTAAQLSRSAISNLWAACGLVEGFLQPSRCSQKWSKTYFTYDVTHKKMRPKIKKKFIHCRLAESFEVLNSSPAQLAKELCS